MRAEFERLVTKGFIGMPLPLRQAMLGLRPVDVAGHYLDPDLATLRLLLQRSGKPELDQLGRSRGAAAARIAFREAFMAAGRTMLPRPVTSRDLTVRGAAGDLPARHYTPEGLAIPGPLLVYFHGGGFVVGDLDSHDPMLRYVAARAGVGVLSVAYRLAPEHPYPAAAEDAVAAYADAAARAGALGADPTRLAIGGDSAGGTLALVAGHENAGGPHPPAALWLINPAVDVTAQSPSLVQFGHGFFLTAPLIDWFMDQYFPDRARMEEPMASPVRLPRLDRLKAVWASAGRFDPLSDHVGMLAEALTAAGVTVEARIEPGLVHNYPNMIGYSMAARDATDRACAWLARTLAAG